MNVFSVRFPRLLYLVLCPALLFAVHISHAQSSGPLSGSARRLEEFNKQADRSIKDDKNGDLHPKKPSAEELRKAKAIRDEIEEDLVGLQSAYNTIVNKLQLKEIIADQFVAETAGKIFEHASRFKRNIKFPKLTEEEHKDPAPVQVNATQRKLLVELCTAILSFFDSPFLQSPNVLDVPKAIEAGKVLENVILKSGDLKARLN